MKRICTQLLALLVLLTALPMLPAGAAETRTIVNPRIEGNVVVGQTLTLAADNGSLAGATDITWQIASGTDLNMYQKPTKTGDTLELTSAEAGMYIFCLATKDGQRVMFPAVGPVQTTASETPTCTYASITSAGGAEAGTVLYGSHSYAGANSEGNTRYQWLIADAADGTFRPISGATDKTYEVALEDEGKYIALQVTPVDEQGGSGEAFQSQVVVPAGSLTFNQPITRAPESGGERGTIIELAVDGNTTTYSEGWSSNTLDSWQIDLGAVQRVNVLELDINEAGAATLEASISSEETGEYLPIDLNGAKTGRIELQSAVYGRYLRVTMHKPASGAMTRRINEVHAFNVSSPPTAENLALTTERGHLEAQSVGYTLTANYDFVSDESVESAQGSRVDWLRYKNGYPGEYEIAATQYASAEEGARYTLTSEDVGCQIGFQVTPMAQEGKYPVGEPVACETVTGAVLEQLEETAPTATVTVTYKDREGEPLEQTMPELYQGITLEGDYEFYDINGDEEDTAATAVRWVKADGSSYREVAKGNTYTVQESDIGSSLAFEVIPASDHDPKVGDPVRSTALPVVEDPQLTVKEELKDTLGTDDLSRVTDDLILKQELRGCSITWTSSDPSTVGADGTVTRKSSDTDVTMTAEIIHPITGTATEEIEVTVLKKSSGSSGGSGGSGGGGGGRGGSSSGGNSSSGSQSAVTVPSDMSKGDNTIVNEIVFNDLDGFDWAKTHIESLYDKGIVSESADGSFRPGDNVTRAEFLKMLLTALEIKLQPAEQSKFEDVEQGQWYSDYVSTAVALGIVNGVSDTRFGAEEPILRQDMAVMTTRALTAQSLQLQAQGIQTEITDMDTVADYAKESVETLVHSGVIIGGEDGAFDPSGVVNRAQAAVVVNRILERIG